MPYEPIVKWLKLRTFNLSTSARFLRKGLVKSRQKNANIEMLNGIFMLVV